MGLLSRRRSAFYLVIVIEDGSGLDFLSQSDAEAEAHPDVLVAVVVMPFDLLMPIVFFNGPFLAIFLNFFCYFWFIVFDAQLINLTMKEKARRPSLSQDSNPARSDRMPLLYHLRHHCSFDPIYESRLCISCLKY